MSGKRAKARRKAGEDRKGSRLAKAKELHARKRRLALKEVKKEKKDVNKIIEGMSDAEREIMKGARIPSLPVFKELEAKGLVKLMVNPKTGEKRLMPTALGLVISDVLKGILTIIPPEEDKH